jgi:hypothetical protein
MANDHIQVIQLRLPSEYVVDSLSTSDELRRIAETARYCLHGKVDA